MSVIPDTARRGRAPVPAAAPSRTVRATLLASASLTIMAAAVIAPSLPQMSRVFAGVPAGDVLVRLCLTITSLAIGLTATVAGAVTDRIGRKPVLVGSLVLYAVAGVGGYVAGDLGVLLATRAVLGLAVGGIMSAVSAMITDLYDGPRRAWFLGLQSAAASLGGVVFLPVAGLLAGVSWHAPFLLYVAAVLILPFAAVGVRETRVPDPVASYRPANGSRARGQRGVIALVFALAVIGTLVFFMAPTQLPFLLQGFGVSPPVVGVAVAGSTASSAVAALGFARVRNRLGRGSITVLSLGALGVGWVIVGLAGSVVQVLAGVLVGGVGVGLIIPNLNLWLSELVDAARRGRVLGGLVSAIFVGQFLSPLVLAPLISWVGLGAAFVVSGVVLPGVTAVIVALLRRLDAG